MRRSSRRRAEQRATPFQDRYALRAGIEGSLSEGIRRHGLRRARYRGQSKTPLQAIAIAAAINEGEHSSDAATNTTRTLIPTQASSFSFCTLATTFGGMMSGHNFPAESFIHPALLAHLTNRIARYRLQAKKMRRLRKSSLYGILAPGR
jgi:hypothetical protein